MSLCVQDIYTTPYKHDNSQVLNKILSTSPSCYRQTQFPRYMHENETGQAISNPRMKGSMYYLVTVCTSLTNNVPPLIMCLRINDEIYRSLLTTEMASTEHTYFTTDLPKIKVSWVLEGIVFTFTLGHYFSY